MAQAPLKASINPVAMTLDAYRFVWRERRAFAASAVAPVVLLSVISALLHLVIGTETALPPEPSGPAATQSGGATQGMAQLLSFVAHVVFYCMFTVFWYRYSFGLSGGATYSAALFQDKRALSMFSKFVGMVAISAVVMIPIAFIAMVVFVTTSPGLLEQIADGGDAMTAMMASGQLIKLGIFGLSIFLFGQWIIGRITLALPAIALDEPVGFRRSWRWTRQYGVAMLFAVLLPSLPVLLGKWLLSFVLGPVRYAVDVFNTVTGHFALALLDNGISFFGYAAGITTLSIAYQRLKAAQADPFEDIP